METLAVETKEVSTHQSAIQLKKLVGCLIAAASPRMAQQGRYCINDISPDVPVAAEHELVSSIVGEVLNSINRYPFSSCLRISAAQSNHTIFMTFRQRPSNGHAYALAHSFSAIQPLVDQLNGSLSVTSSGLQEMKVLLSFEVR